MDENRVVEILTGGQFQGNLWEKGGHRRIYFNAATIATSQGLDWGRYNTGNISSASLNGQKISNNACRRILDDLQYVKLWYDLTDRKFYSKGEFATGDAQEMKSAFVAAAKAAIA